MTDQINRREFVTAVAATGLASTLGSAEARATSTTKYTAPAVHGARARPMVIASANGHKHTNGGTKTCVETAFDASTAPRSTRSKPRCTTRSRSPGRWV